MGSTVLFFPQDTGYGGPEVPRVEGDGPDCQLCGGSGPVGLKQVWCDGLSQ